MTEGTVRRETQRTENDPRKIATRITLITFALTLATAFVTLFLVPNEDKTPIDNYMMPLVALSAGYSYFLTRRGEHIRGIYILLGVIALASASYPFAANNIGWQTAIGMLLVVTGIANSTLPPKAAGRVSAAAFALAIVIVVIELLVEGVTDIPVTTVSIIVTGVLGFIYTGIILSRFRQFSLRTKLIAAFIAISIVSVGVVIFAVSRSVLGQLTVEAGRELTGVARLSSSSITAELVKQLDLLRALALNDVLNDELAKVNADATGDPVRLEQLDRQWRAADLAGNDSDPLVQSVLTHPISAQLRELSDAFPENVELLVTDRHGALVASTTRMPIYHQAAETWWRAAYQDGQGGVYISQPVFDEKNQTLVLHIAVPIMERTGAGEVTGILRATVDLEAFVAAFEAGRFGETGRTEIYLPNGSELEIGREADGEFELHLEEAPQDFITALQSGQPFMDTTHDGVPVLAGVSSLQSPGDTNADAALQSLEWRVVAIQDRTEALKIVTSARRNAQLAGLGILLLAGLLGIGVAQFLTDPLALRLLEQEIIETFLRAFRGGLGDLLPP
ncbi:MAG: cache domain-containing protein, partial [Anaerolineales bacterium]|nr:cache domain-containing protein [Anaerolineales bacterium]